jgi:hypothetical protein
MLNKTPNLFTLFAFFLLLAIPLNAQNTAGGHKSAVTSIIYTEDNIISSDEDGFIVIWDKTKMESSERFQLSFYSIKKMVKHPAKDEICILESGDMDNYRISAWNYKTKEKLFSVHSYEQITFINYSTAGNYIITAGLDGHHLSMLDSVSGKVISSLDIPEGIVTFGVTGRNERNVLLYQSEQEDMKGHILYVDTVAQSIIGSFQAPENLSSPVIFGNNRYLAGVSSLGLLLVDAASGNVFSYINNIDKNALLYPAFDGFFCISREDRLYIYRFNVDSRNNLVRRYRIAVPLTDNISIGAFAFIDNAFPVFANNNEIFLVRQLISEQRSTISSFKKDHQTRITDIEAGGKSIAFLTESGNLGFIQLDYNLMEKSGTIVTQNKTGYTRLTSAAAAADGEDQFILWQNANTRNVPQLVRANQAAASLNIFPGRFPLRSVVFKNNVLLLLDTAGNIAVRKTDNIAAITSTTKASFTFSSVGAADAAIVNDNYFILCRSVIGNNSPFLLINYNTGETVPVNLRESSITAGIRVYSGPSGNIFAATVQRDIGAKTIMSKLPGTGGAATGAVNFYNYPAEAVFLSIAESANYAAIAVSSDGASVWREDNAVRFDRTPGLPVKLIGSDKYFICLDSEGNISWHDNIHGKLLATFSLYEDKWILTNY